ncbi:dipeptide ABC transporter ATP-binding protein [Pseudonocardia eucalypti]|uniref:Dipeptide ABC transporter ATP-binding protein n=1 Tax=Pseudonocardia eucalypti TaxID=648755 RepID=A0ABP9QIP6_9PSEU|nr:oligopeptide/dipeptide ABC transporter ATP-binding protein [Pseudonocardia eucalypti]
MSATAFEGTSEPAYGAPAPAEGRPLVEVRGLNVVFRKGRSLGAPRLVRAVNDVSFSIERGETLGLVGESGSGKSTTGRALLKLVPYTAGEVRVAGRDLSGLAGSELRRARRNMQMVFQDPYSSLDPSCTVAASIAEPLLVHERLAPREARARVTELLELVGLTGGHADRYPYEFSGGQRQRIAIARALALHPQFVVCDEAVSALDVSTQNQVINLLERLRAELHLSYLFIAHDLAVVRHISDRVAVMYLGRIVESGPTDRVYNRPAHPYTEALLSAIPDASPHRVKRERILLAGEPPDPANPPAGCPLQTRCRYVMDVCRQRMPEATPVHGGGEVACHLQTSGPNLSGAPLGGAATP